MVRLDSPRQERTISGPRKRMLSATAAFSGGKGTLAKPRVAMARVMEWATVNAVMVLISIILPSTISNNPSTKRRWSTPSRMW